MPSRLLTPGFASRSKRISPSVSEFDTIAELKSGIEQQLKDSKVYGQGLEARDKLTDLLVEKIAVAVSDELVEADVTRHLEGEGRLEDKEHRAEVTGQSEKSFKVQMILDEIALAAYSIFPNPSLDHFSISFEQNDARMIHILDQQGKIVRSIESNEATTVVQTDHLAAGIYNIVIESATFQYPVKKWMKVAP
jgi:trigger factor